MVTWFIPAWATLCGAIASGARPFTPANGMTLLLTLLLVEAGWGTLWAALATTDWATPLRRWRHWRLGNTPHLLPYTQPGSPGHRAVSWLAQLRSWYRSVLAPSVGPALGATVMGATLSLMLATVVGLRIFTLTLAIFALMQSAMMLEMTPKGPAKGWDALFRVAAPWLAGHLVFAELSLPSLGLAAAFALSVAGASSSETRWGQHLWAAGQVAVAALFVLLSKPLVAPFLTLLLFPQWLLIVWADDSSLRDWTRNAWPWLAAAMALAAWTL